MPLSHLLRLGTVNRCPNPGSGDFVPERPAPSRWRSHSRDLGEMRSVEPLPFEQPYNEEELAASSPGERIAGRLGVKLPHCSALAAELFTDLDTKTHGVGWWAGMVPVQASILIGDHLYHSVAAIPDLLVEGRLHHVELVSAWAEQERRWARHVASGGDPRKFPPPVDPKDELPFEVEDMYLTDLFRAIAQILDCLAVAVIAIGDLPVPLYRAAWPATLNLLTDIKATTPFADDVIRVVQKSGPFGWLEWVLAMRNMLVHRPRLVGIGSVRVIGTDIVAPSVPMHDRLRIVHHLPRRPERSVVESWLLGGGPHHAYLDEDGGVTTERMLVATRELAEGLAELCQVRWTARRGNGNSQRHFTAQWPDRKTKSNLTFEGFSPGSDQFQGDTIMLHGTLGRRLRAAALLDDARTSVWADVASS